MQPTTPALLLTLLLPLLTTARSPLLLSKRVLDDPVRQYIGHMCSPYVTNATRTTSVLQNSTAFYLSLASSPFPCDINIYIEYMCYSTSNSTSSLLAEQSCICGSNLFEMWDACDTCEIDHGFIPDISNSAISSSRSALYSAECTPATPTVPFTALWDSKVNITSIELAPLETQGPDKAVNNTALSVYWTGKESPSVSLGGVNKVKQTGTGSGSGSAAPASTSKAGAAEVGRERGVTGVVAVVVVGLLMVV